MSGLTALVLAGARPGGDPLAAYAGVRHKALIDIGGLSMISRVVSALDASPQIGRIVIALDQQDIFASLTGPARNSKKLVVTLAQASGPSATVATVLEHEGTPLLVTTADHALLKPEWVQDFLRGCRPDIDVAIAMARKAAVLTAAPDTQRTYLRFADGDYSGCNLFLLQTPAAAGVIQLWQQLEAERKQPLRMMRRLGLGYALRYRFGLLRLDQALDRLGALSGDARIHAIEMADGRAAIDVDKPADLDLVRRLVST